MPDPIYEEPILPHTHVTEPEPIFTDRLILIPFTLERIRAAMDTTHHRAELGRLLAAQIPASWPGEDFADILPLIEGATEAQPQISGWTRLILLPEPTASGVGRTLIGGVGLTGAPDPTGCVAFGYDIIPEYQRHGYATEATRAFLNWVRTEPGILRITAECEEDNHASIRVLQKLGMETVGKTGTLLLWDRGAL